MTLTQKILVAGLAVFALMVLINITTPSECKVDVSVMSNACKDLIYK